MMRVTRMIGEAFVLLLATSGAAAAPREDPPDLPPAGVALRIQTADAPAPWKMEVTNTGNEMLRLAADGRLLRLEIRPPADATPDPTTEKAKKGKNAKKDPSVECRAPASLRPAIVADDRAVALPPGARYQEDFDPALFCFDKEQREALVPGATLVAKLGFVPATAKRGSPARQSSPYVAEPMSPNAAVSPLKEVVATAFTIPEPSAKPKDPAAPKDKQADADPGAPRMEISAPRWVDSEGARSLSFSVTVSNAGKRPLVAHLRNENLSFDVEGPSGSAHCQIWNGQRKLVKDFFKTMAPGGRESMTVLLGEVCPAMVFDTPGLYKVTPRITLLDEPGRSPVSSWTGTAVAAQPTIVRMRSGSRPFYRQPPQVLPGTGSRK
jgi:hypothetical protein